MRKRRSRPAAGSLDRALDSIMLFILMMRRFACGLLLYLIAVVGGTQQTEAPPFKLEQYLSPAFQVSQRELKYGNATIQVVQVKGLGQAPPFMCRAWLRVTVGGEDKFSRYFGDIRGTGSPYGLVIAEDLGPYMTVVKNGGSDERLYLVDREGLVVEVPGGIFLTSPDGRYVFSQSKSTAGGLRVVDLHNGVVVFSSDQLPAVDAWYRASAAVFFTPARSAKPGIAYWYDFSKHRFDPRETSSEVLRTAREWYYSFDPGDYEDCSGREYP